MKRLTNQTIILFFIIGLALLTLFYFLNQYYFSNPRQKIESSPATQFKGPTGSPYVVGPSGPPPYSN